MKVKRSLATTIGILAAAAFFTPVFPLAGIGAHYGFDLSLSMKDAVNERAPLGDLKLAAKNFGGVFPAGYKDTLSGADIPVTINRTGFKRTWFNLGGKMYVDVLPFVDALEISANYGMWEYKGSIKYPKQITFTSGNVSPTSDIRDIAQIEYDSTDITMSGLGLSNPFLKNTPYAKLQFDATVRKYLLKLPPVANILKCYGGAGASLFFATPVLSSAFIEKTLGNTLAGVHDVNNLQGSLFGSNTDAMKKLGQQFLKDLFTPHWGMHLDLGCMIKFPVMPAGLYVDGKLLLPFGNMDKDCPGLKATGILLNCGLLFAL